MMGEKNLSLLKLMEINLIRRKILENIPSFSKIDNLVKTSRRMNALVQCERIKKNILRYDDSQFVKINIKRGLSANSVLKFEDVLFEENYFVLDDLDYLESFFGETVLDDNSIRYLIHNKVKNIDESDRQLFMKSFVEKMNLNCQMRKNATTLHFWINFSCENHFMLLDAFRYMNHNNISCIEVPITIFLSDTIKYRGIGNGIFDNLSKVHKLVISSSLSTNDFNRLLENRSVIDIVLKELGRRNNPILILTHYEGGYNTFINLVGFVFEISNKYNVKMKCDFFPKFPLLNSRHNIIPSIERYINLPIIKSLYCVFNIVEHSKAFVSIIKFLKHFTNLETLKLSFLFFDIQKDLKRMKILDYSTLSLKNCKKIKKIRFDFEHNISNFNDKRMNILHSNLKYIVSLMPDTIEVLELLNVSNFYLTNEIADILSESFPNIKVLVTSKITYENYNCLSAFKNLGILMPYNDYPTHIPSTVKLLIIRHYEYWNNEDCIPVKEDLLKTYSTIFLNQLQCHQRKYVFFNDILNWDLYKRVIQGLY